jgi:acyl-CoA thioesterase FadM
MIHHRETTYGEALTARTWVARVRRQLLSTREVRIATANGPVASATQEWVHVSADLKPLRASPEMVDAFPAHEREASVALPACAAIADAPAHRFALRPWQIWMDPLGHVNHPMYVEFADEAVARVLARAGVAEASLAPIAEHAIFRVGIAASAEIEVHTRLAGTTAEGAAVIAHRIVGEGGVLCAELTTVRTLATQPDRLREALLSIEGNR